MRSRLTLNHCCTGILVDFITEVLTLGYEEEPDYRALMAILSRTASVSVAKFKKRAGSKSTPRPKKRAAMSYEESDEEDIVVIDDEEDEGMKCDR